MVTRGADVYRVEPLAGPVDATVSLPGSKSLTNRALIAAALATGRSVLTGALASDDTRHMADALLALGFGVDVDLDAATVAVTGGAGRVPSPTARVSAGLAGTVARFVAPVLCLGEGPYELDGEPRLRERPMAPLLDALGALGARVTPLGRPGHLPVRVDGAGVRGGRVAVPGDTSSQFLSGLLLAGPCLPDGVVVDVTSPLVSKPYVDMTLAVMAAFGVEAERDGYDSFRVAGGRAYRATAYAVEPDATAASYFFAAAAVTGGRVRVEGIGPESVQGDARFVDLLAEMGAHATAGPGWTEVEGGPPLRGITADLRDMSDTVMTLAVVAAFAEGPTEITGVGFIREKETDRIGALVGELRRAGIDAEERPDGLVVRPGSPRPTRFETHDDHRMAMSLALFGLVHHGIEIADPHCVDKTFPTYFEVFESLRR